MQPCFCFKQQRIERLVGRVARGMDKNHTFPLIGGSCRHKSSRCRAALNSQARRILSFILTADDDCGPAFLLQ